MPTSAKLPEEPANEPLLYQMVVNALRAEILRGVYPIGAALPSELTLVGRFGVSRHTIREALRNLRDLGLVESRQGKGTLVLKPGGSQTYVHRVNSIADLHDYKLDSVYDNEAITLKLDAELAERLSAKAGETWIRIGGLRYEPASKKAICAVEIFVPGRFAGIGRVLGRRSGPIYGLIEDVYGESINQVDQTLRVTPIHASTAEALRLDTSETALEIKRVYRLLDGSPAEITFNYYRPDTFNFSMTLTRVRTGN